MRRLGIDGRGIRDALLAVAGVSCLGATPVLAQVATDTPAGTTATSGGSNGSSWRFYGGAEYLYWRVKNAPLGIPLVSTGSEQNKGGFLNNSETTILYGAPFSPASGGNGSQKFPGFSGTRLTFGAYIDDDRRYAVEASGFLLQHRSAGYSISGNGTGTQGVRIPVHNSVPYAPGGSCDVDNAAICQIGLIEDGVPVVLPGDIAGNVAVSNTLQLWGMDLLGVARLYQDSNWRISGLGGVGFINLSESLGLTSNIAGLNGTEFQGQSGTVSDLFKTSNKFYGATVGLRTTYTYGRLSADLTGKLGIGVSHEVLTVNGWYQDYNAPFPNSSGPYGVFAQPANSGTTTSNKFAVVPQVQIKLGYDITDNIQVSVGWSFLFDSNVIRPGLEMSRDIPKGQTYQQDPSSTSTTSPARVFRGTTFWAQGLNVGLTYRF